MAFAWSGLFVGCLRSRSVRLVLPINIVFFFFLHLLNWIISVRFVES